MALLTPPCHFSTLLTLFAIIGIISRLLFPFANASVFLLILTITPSSGLIDNYTYIDMNIKNMSLNIMARNDKWFLINDETGSLSSTHVIKLVFLFITFRPFGLRQAIKAA